MSEQINKTSSKLNPKYFWRVVIKRFVLSFIVLALMFFLPAWTINYWNAWVYILILLVPMIFVVKYLHDHDPQLLERRMRMREKQKTQRLSQLVSWPFFLLIFIIPGFDYRLNWSNIPLSVIIISELVVLLSYLFIALVFKTNSYASRIVEVEKNQQVITTGPYAIVRHPMYLGVLTMFVFSPLALGSYWAVIPAMIIVPILIVRIRDEEKELVEQLGGYKEYAKKTRYRLIPGIW